MFLFLFYSYGGGGSLREHTCSVKAVHHDFNYEWCVMLRLDTAGINGQRSAALIFLHGARKLVGPQSLSQADDCAPRELTSVRDHDLDVITGETSYQ